MKKIFVAVVSVLFVAQTALAMTFQQPVKIGEVIYPPYGYFEIKGATYHKGSRCSRTDEPYKHALNLYEKGTAQFGTGNDALYFHYDENTKGEDPLYKGGRFSLSRFGSKDINNAVQILPGIPTNIWRVKTNSNRTFFIIEQGSAAGFGICHVVIGKNKDGKWVQFFDTRDVKKQYLGEKAERNIGGEWGVFHFAENTIIMKYGKYRRIDVFNAQGEFRFKWDEAAQWFSIEQVVY